MIHDLTDLESLLHQYDHERVLVGPLLNLWTNSSFRVFNIAGKSGKIYETIGLGFFELEIDAQRRRADIVAALEGRFGEVEIFDNQLKMAQMAHTLWANDETDRFLATVSSETSPRNAIDTATHAPQSARDQAQPILACDPTQVSEPPYLSLSDTDSFANPGTLAESGSYLEALRNLPAAGARSAVSKKHRLWVLSGVTAYVAVCFVVGFLIGTMVLARLTSVRSTAHEAKFSSDVAASITAGNDSSRTTGAVTDASPAGSIGTANREAQLSEAVRATSSSLPTSQPSVADRQADVTVSPEAQPPQNLNDQAGAVADERLSQSPKAQDNRADDSLSLPQSAPPQTVKTESSAAETVPLSIPQPLEVAPTQVFVSPASTQIIASHDGPQLLPSESATPELPEELSTEPQRQALISAIVPLPRPRPAVNAVSSGPPRRREGARSPLFNLFGH